MNQHCVILQQSGKRAPKVCQHRTAQVLPSRADRAQVYNFLFLFQQFVTLQVATTTSVRAMYRSKKKRVSCSLLTINFAVKAGDGVVWWRSSTHCSGFVLGNIELNNHRNFSLYSHSCGYHFSYGLVFTYGFVLSFNGRQTNSRLSFYFLVVLEGIYCTTAVCCWRLMMKTIKSGKRTNTMCMNAWVEVEMNWGNKSNGNEKLLLRKGEITMP